MPHCAVHHTCRRLSNLIRHVCQHDLNNSTGCHPVRVFVLSVLSHSFCLLPLQFVLSSNIAPPSSLLSDAKELCWNCWCWPQLSIHPFWILTLFLSLYSAYTGSSSRQFRSSVLEATIAFWASVGRYIQALAPYSRKYKINVVSCAKADIHKLMGIQIRSPARNEQMQNRSSQLRHAKRLMPVAGTVTKAQL